MQRDRSKPRSAIAAALLIAVLLVAAACGSDDQSVLADPTAPTTAAVGTATTTPVLSEKGSFELPSGPDEVVVRIAECGGFVPIAESLSCMPGISVMGDGTVIVAKPPTFQNSAKALPELLVGSIDRESLANLVSKADGAGFLADGVDFGLPQVTDQSSTKMTLVVDGKVHQLEAYALDFSGPDAQPADIGITGSQGDLRQSLADLTSATQNSIELTADPYEANKVTVFGLFRPADSDSGVTEDATWPLDDPNAWPKSHGSQLCKTYSGTDAAAALKAAGGATALASWTVAAPVDGKAGASKPVLLAFRPLLPDETDNCAS